MPENQNKRSSKKRKTKRNTDIQRKPRNPVKDIRTVEPNRIIFALDIGTRAVKGILGFFEAEKFIVADCDIVEHKTRTMYEGQIHDIEDVTKAAKIIIENIEKRTGIKIKKVSVAAAGRVLRTYQSEVSKDLAADEKVTGDLILSMEIEALRQAQSMLEGVYSEGEAGFEFHCVGHSVQNYYLNGLTVANPVGHKGKKLSLKLLATFLPSIVIDSLYSVVDNLDLEISCLTLEPIAALNATIPKSIRILNIVLVDIGAGTSDIAITRDGYIHAYAMVPYAGDSITEKIIKEYLVDFDEAERIKKSLDKSNEEISFKNILGKSIKAAKDEIIQKILPQVENLSLIICEKIMEYNKQTPEAVFLVGGGSKTPLISTYIAQKLGIEGDRVTVSGREIIKDVVFQGRSISGPESVTPLGIALTTGEGIEKGIFAIKFNGKDISLFNSRNTHISQILAKQNISPDMLMGKMGKKLTFKLNGETKVIRGDFGVPAKILVNGEEAAMDSLVANGSVIEFTPAQNGKDGTADVFSLTNGMEPFKITANGNELYAGFVIKINEKTIYENVPVNEGDKIELKIINTVSQLVENLGISGENKKFTANGMEVSEKYRLMPFDKIEII